MLKITELVRAELLEWATRAVLNPLSETFWVVCAVLALMWGRQL